jgi:signal transduction histidine kinase
VPVLIRGVAWGNLYLTEKAGGDGFTEEDEEVVRLLASQAAVAIENARLYESATHWSQQLEALHEVLRSIVGETQLPRLLELVARRLRELVEAEAILIVRPTPGGSLRIAAVAGSITEDWLGRRLDPRHSKTGRVLEGRRSVRVDDVFSDPEIDQQLAREQGLRSAMFVPLVVGNRALGVVIVQNKLGADTRFSDADLRLAEIFAGRAAVACDLSERVDRDTMRRVIEGQELERRRLARELHDETGQALTSILLGLKSIRSANGPQAAVQAEEEVRGLVVQALQEVRRLAVELRPKALDDFGLVAALERLAESFTEQTGIAIAFQSLLPSARLTPEIETALYRIVQESLTNIVKHAQAHSVSIVLGRKSDSVSVIVEDDGVGFDPDRTREGGLGLIGMRERVSLIGGRLTIESRPGAGTAFVAEVPVS